MNTENVENKNDQKLMRKASNDRYYANKGKVLHHNKYHNSDDRNIKLVMKYIDDEPFITAFLAEIKKRDILRQIK
jgi:hypothetical protein